MLGTLRLLVAGAAVLALTSSALASPPQTSVTAGHGKLVGYANGSSLAVAAEFGLTPELAATGQLGPNSTAIGAKYELNPSLAAYGQLIGVGGRQYLDLGAIYRHAVDRNLLLVFDGSFVQLLGSGSGQPYLDVSAWYSLTPQWTVFGGLASGGRSYLGAEYAVDRNLSVIARHDGGLVLGAELRF